MLIFTDGSLLPCAEPRQGTLLVPTSLPLAPPDGLSPGHAPACTGGRNRVQYLQATVDLTPHFASGSDLRTSASSVRHIRFGEGPNQVSDRLIVWGTGTNDTSAAVLCCTRNNVCSKRSHEAVPLTYIPFLFVEM